MRLRNAGATPRRFCCFVRCDPRPTPAPPRYLNRAVYQRANASDRGLPARRTRELIFEFLFPAGFAGHSNRPAIEVRRRTVLSFPSFIGQPSARDRFTQFSAFPQRARLPRDNRTLLARVLIEIPRPVGWALDFIRRRKNGRAGSG